MKIDVLTLFPDMFNCFLTESIIARAIVKNKVEINIIDIRNYTTYKNNQVDDYQFGGGGGMVLMCEPVFNAINSVKKKDSHVILLTPRGKTFNQTKAYEFSKYKHLIILCGHYEGFDERIYSLADEIVSIGDFVLTGGEIPSMMIIDSVVRLLDGVISKTSLESESFDDGLLDYPVYTKPRIFNDMEVPEVLLSGNHKLINEYREKERKRITKEYRNDLLK
ncbi:MAG: tRNA (guanosine(37)-N1)-methyltransferase TrmD [Tenericutes bacterium]|nr:tRNA (guanosine(37)-N1)-methyltransferase TrmD [Mycoplasmatota bacterium]